MITCGLKLTHDSAIAVFEDNKLITSIELEKVDNNNRFKIIDSISTINSVLTENEIKLSNIDRFVIDGWVGLENSYVKVMDTVKELEFKVAPYHEMNLDNHVVEKYAFHNLVINKGKQSYESYTHVAGHILSAYFTSPFHQNEESSYVLIWDGGMYPRLYFYDASTNDITNHGPLFFMGVNIYSIFAQHFGPFKINENVIKDELSIAGKVMAYLGYGKVNEAIVNDLKQVYQTTIERASNIMCISQYPFLFTQAFKNVVKRKRYADEDVLTSFHFFLEELLLGTLRKYAHSNLCIAGGGALNIKWNSAILRSKVFQHIWVPPFPNDSGSAIGTGLCSLYHHNILKNKIFDWCVYSGPKLSPSRVLTGWGHVQFSVEQLAKLLADEQEPVIFLHGRAELGPRALGNRSILASPSAPEMKNRLNYIKIREFYRPIAPICMEEYAEKIFDPGLPDRYMLFEHNVREEWQDKIPAIVHIDKSARLQTVTPSSNPVLYSLLSEFYKITGLPILCNTSANLKGCGFFPDVASAMKWGQVKYIWSDGVLYFKSN